MQIDILKVLLWSQIGASIETLENAIIKCPDKLWDNQANKSQYWDITYHTLFFLDLYLSESLEGFAPPTPFTTLLDKTGKKRPERVYSRNELQEYLEYCRKKCISKLESLTEDNALQQCGFSWVNGNIVELFIYNMRHVQHHAAQLNLILRQELDQGSTWVFKAKQ